MKHILFRVILLMFLTNTSACKKEGMGIIGLSGEFALTNGTCTPYCIIAISGNTLTLKGINTKGSTVIIYQESYIRNSKDANIYDFVNEQGTYITAISTTDFTFTSKSRTCKFSK
jgi:hypothetical protein